MATRAAAAAAAAELAANQPPGDDDAGPSNPPDFAAVVAQLAEVRREFALLQEASQRGPLGLNVANAPSSNALLTLGSELIKGSKKFSGARGPASDDVADWLKDLETGFESNEKICKQTYDDEQKVAFARRLLEGDAATFVRNLVDNELEVAKDWLLFKSRMQEHYSNPMMVQEGHYQALFDLVGRYKNTRDLQSLVRDHRLVCAKLPQLEPTTAFYSFLTSLPNDAAAQIRLHNKVDLEEAYRVVLAFRNVHTASNAGGNNKAQPNATNKFQRAVPVASSTNGNSGSGGAQQPVASKPDKGPSAADTKLANRGFQATSTGFYPKTLHGNLKNAGADGDNLKDFLRVNNICFYCRNEGHSASACRAGKPKN